MPSTKIIDVHRRDRIRWNESEDSPVEEQLGFEAADDGFGLPESVLLAFEGQQRDRKSLATDRVGHHLGLIGRHGFVVEALKEDERARNAIDEMNRRSRPVQI